MPEGLHFQSLLVAALVDRRAAGLREAAVNHTEIIELDGGVFEGAGADFGALGGAAAAEVVETERGIEPCAWRPVKGVAKDESFMVAVANDRDEETRFVNVLACGSGGMGEPDDV